MTPDMLLMLAWIATHTDLQTDVKPPEVRYVSHKEICQRNAISSLECLTDTVHGSINPYTNVLLINNDVNEKQQRAAMFHELVHAAQMRSGKIEEQKRACLEYEAHTITNRWLGEQMLLDYDDGYTKQFVLEQYEAACAFAEYCEPNNFQILRMLGISCQRFVFLPLPLQVVVCPQRIPQPIPAQFCPVSK